MPPLPSPPLPSPFPYKVVFQGEELPGPKVYNTRNRLPSTGNLCRNSLGNHTSNAANRPLDYKAMLMAAKNNMQSQAEKRLSSKGLSLSRKEKQAAPVAAILSSMGVNRVPSLVKVK